VSAANGKSSSDSCDLYSPGHRAHWIPALRAVGNAAADLRFRATLVVAADGVIVAFDPDGGLVRYRTHSTDQIRRITTPGDEVIVCESYRILGIPGPRLTTKVFCIALDRDELRPCSASPITAATPEALAEQLATRGGFSVPGQEVLAAIDVSAGERGDRADQ
jgi:hypothetical protein